MKLTKRTLLVGTLAILTLTACKKKGCTDPMAQNYSEEAKKDDGGCTYGISVPSTYTFTRNGNSTVSFSGQTTRLEMLTEMVTYMKTANTAGVSVDATTLHNMYANSGYTWVDADGLGMTGSSKQLKDKTAYASPGGSPDAAVQAMFEGYMTSLANLSATTVTSVEDGAPGVGGVWPNDGVKGPYLMDGNGFEFAQIIEKGLMSAVFMSQMTVNYLGGLNDDDNTNMVDEAGGKYYTEMEHHWDEAYGYFTSATNYPTAGADRFWGKYADGREAILQSATKIVVAFRTGRAAIVGRDYTTRDAQVTIIRDEMEKLAAGSAIHYLNSAKANLTNPTARNHSLSEAYAFLEGMKYGYNAISGSGMTSAQITTALGYLGTDFNAVTITDINNTIDIIAGNTGLDAVKGSL